MIKCEHADNKYCPIGKSRCPGVCVYSEIMENISLGIIVFDMSSERIIFKNKLFSEIFRDVMHPDEFDTWVQMLLTEDNPCSSSSPPRMPPPINYNGRIYGYTIYSIKDKYVWVFVRDITEKTRLESIAEAINTSNNIGYIFSGVRHEIGNPINSIKTALSVLQANFDTFTKDTVMSYLTRTIADIRRVEDLLKSLKNFNMYETPNLENINMTLFVERFVSLIAEDFKGNGISIAHTLYPGAESVYGDSRALQQVMLNIVTNAADALQEEEEPYIAISVFRNAEQVEIVVEDNGCGISEAGQKDLFKPFVTSKQKGTGLGLIIARKMLATMHGTIFLESYENHGTIVHISLPAEGVSIR